MRYLSRAEFASMGYRPRPPYDHLLFIEREDEAGKIYSHQINSWQYGIGPDVIEWFNSNVEPLDFSHKAPFWIADYCERPVHKTFFYNAYLAFYRLDDAVRFKLTWQ